MRDVGRRERRKRGIRRGEGRVGDGDVGAGDQGARAGRRYPPRAGRRSPHSVRCAHRPLRHHGGVHCASIYGGASILRCVHCASIVCASSTASTRRAGRRYPVHLRAHGIPAGPAEHVRPPRTGPATAPASGGSPRPPAAAPAPDPPVGGQRETRAHTPGEASGPAPPPKTGGEETGAWDSCQPGGDGEEKGPSLISGSDSGETACHCCHQGTGGHNQTPSVPCWPNGTRHANGVIH
jgi:hypothetical protein